MDMRNISGMLLIVFSLLAITCLVYFKLIITKPKNYIDTFCPIDKIHESTIIMFDKSDPFNENQIKHVKNRILNIEKNLKTFEKISITVIDVNKYNNSFTRNVLSMCKPKEGKDANRFYENKKFLDWDYHHIFKEKLNEVTLYLLSNSQAPRSPISKSIALSISTDPRVLKSVNNKFILFSDLLEHTNSHSAYRGSFDEKNIQENIPDNIKKWLSNAKIEIKVIRRESYISHQKSAKQIWGNFFTSIGAQANFEDF